MKSSSNIREVIAFLQQLQVHNDRAWFKAHKDEYEAVRKPWEADMERLISLVSQFDGNVRGLDLKGCVYRIYRDIRFSHDKSPYKNYFSGVLGKGGRHTVMSGSYVHFQPDNIMLGGGVWWPQKPILDKLRALIDAEPDEFLKIVTAPEFTSRFHWESDALKTMPKDYPREHPLSQYLKMKEYIVMMRPGLDYFDCDDWVERMAADLHHLQPLHDFLNYVFE
ncbi:MAG: DUF2461 domain-containing protein [Muribaculaceae bacterium]|nr:DUF2461 domain-containing protein [Muribaculaceae bacterium]